MERSLVCENRDWLIELSFCDEPQKRSELARRIAEDTADRWDKMSSGKGPEMKSMMSERDWSQINALKMKIKEVPEFHRMALELGIDPLKKK